MSNKDIPRSIPSDADPSSVCKPGNSRPSNTRAMGHKETGCRITVAGITRPPWSWTGDKTSPASQSSYVPSLPWQPGTSLCKRDEARHSRHPIIPGAGRVAANANAARPRTPPHRIAGAHANLSQTRRSTAIRRAYV